MTETVGRPMEILLVEDTTTFARIAIGALRQGNVQHRLTWMRDGADAAQFLWQQGKYTQAPRPDLILLDLGLPGKDGRELLSELKADEARSSIPVVVMTASTNEEDRFVSENLNVQGYLVKPVNLQSFLELVEQLNRYWHEDMIVPTAT